MINNFMNNLNRTCIFFLLVGVIYVIYRYQQWTIQQASESKEENDNNETIQNNIDNIDNIDNLSNISMSIESNLDSEVYKQDSVVSDGLSLLDQQTNISQDSLLL